MKEATVRDVDESFYKLNSDTTGFYRTNYPPERLSKLGRNHKDLSIQDNIGLVGDAAALAIAGNSTSAGLLSLCENYHNENNYLVWQQVLTSLGTIRSIFSTDEVVSTGLKKFVLKLVTPATEKIGWSFKPDEGLLTGQLRALLILSAGGVGHEQTIKKAKAIFSEYSSGNKDAIHPSLRNAVFRLAIENGGKDAYEIVKNEYLNTTSIDGKEITLGAMGRVQTTDLVNDFLDFQFSDKVAVQDIHTGAFSLAINGKARDAFWRYVKSNWDTVYNKLSANSVVLDRYLKNTLNRFSSHEMERDITMFFEGKDTKGYDKGLSQISDTVKANADYRQRDGKLVLKWLQAHGYSS